MIHLTPLPEGILLPVRAQPGASSNGIRGAHNGALKVAITQVAEKGKANDALVQVLAKALGVKRSQIELCSGETNRNKTFLVRSIALEILQAKIAELLERSA
jgi:uncharacterized protein (TIGR00251 family)